MSDHGRWQVDDEGEGRNEETRKWIAEASVDFSGLRFVARSHLDKKQSEPKNEEQELSQPNIQPLFVEGAAIDFGGFSFPWLANFERAEFHGEAWFWGTAFNGQAKFQDAKFLEKAIFEGAQFYRPVWFARDQMMFLQSTKATFGVTSYRSWKHSFDPEGDHTPHAAEFYGQAEFVNAQFHNWSWFGNVKFHDTARFNDVQFHLTGFNRTEFKDAVFVRVEFKEQADFSGAIFQERGTFSDAKFQGITEFGRAQFNGHAEFEHTQFHDEARFSNAQFNGGATFWSTQFRGWTTFGEGQFQQQANFRYAAFQERVSFENAKFLGASWFAGAAFHASASFREAKFGTKEVATDADFTGIKVDRDFDLTRAEFVKVPVFKQADFKQAPDLDNVKFKLPSFWRRPEADLIATYRALRRMAIQGADYEREQMAFMGEIRSKRGTEHKWYHGGFWFGIFYDALSDFGGSLWRPFLAWALCIVGFAIYFLGQNPDMTAKREELHRGGAIGQAITYSITAWNAAWQQPLPACVNEGDLDTSQTGFSGLVNKVRSKTNIVNEALSIAYHNAVVVLDSSGDSAHRSFGCLYGLERYGGNPVAYVPRSVAIASGIQKVLSAIFIFLFGLAVRNMLKMK